MDHLIAWSLIGLLVVAGVILVVRIALRARRDRRTGRGQGKSSFIDLRRPR